MFAMRNAGFANESARVLMPPDKAVRDDGDLAHGFRQPSAASMMDVAAREALPGLRDRTDRRSPLVAGPMNSAPGA
ncbi:hypothetical protein V5799_017716 [Amblyomma americanum]|uniref:Uncharacterized protein n=1 Tax=Amblyomma americanum TaxID=6943 RepID=A0AAQ4F1B9_AMBAM